MTTNYQHDLGPGEAGSGSTAPGTSGAAGSSPGAPSSSGGSGAQDKAREAAGTAADEGKHVAGVATDEAKKVASEATDQLRGLVDEATQQVAQQTSAQKSRLADTVRTFGDDLQSMQRGETSSGLASQVLSQVSDQARTLASRLDEREPADLLEDVRRFARQRPGTFLLGALAAGVVAGRLARGAKGARDGSTGSASVGAQQPPRSVGRTPGAPVPTAAVSPAVDRTSPAYLAEGGDAGPSYLGTEDATAAPTTGLDEPYLDGPLDGPEGRGTGRR